MKFRTLLIVFLAPVIILSCKQQAKEASSEPEVVGEVVEERDVFNEIVDANKVFIEKFNAHDGAAIAQLYTEDGRLMPTGSPVLEGREAIGNFWSGIFELGINSAELTTVHVEAHGDTAAEEGAYKLFGADGTQLDEGKYMIIWKEVDGKWHLDRDIFNTNLPSTQ
jgi:uncharacterized protein (TIGR02246 family)